MAAAVPAMVAAARARTDDGRPPESRSPATRCRNELIAVLTQERDDVGFLRVERVPLPPPFEDVFAREDDRLDEPPEPLDERPLDEPPEERPLDLGAEDDARVLAVRDEPLLRAAAERPLPPEDDPFALLDDWLRLLLDDWSRFLDDEPERLRLTSPSSISPRQAPVSSSSSST